MISISIKKEKEKFAKLNHPWIFSNAIEKVEKNPNSGEIVRVVNSKNEFIGYGAFSTSSKIKIRLLEWNETAVVDDNWWRKRITEAIDRRKDLIHDPKTNACRLVYSEADLIPGLIVDKYADVLVVQLLTGVVEKMKSIIIEHLKTLLNPRIIYERSDSEVRKLEGLGLTSDFLFGVSDEEYVEVLENGYRFLVDYKKGQKTGYFLDQRNNRKIIGSYATNKNILDCFCYSGGFSIYCAANNAKSITCIDSSERAIDLATKNLTLNNLISNVTFRTENVSDLLRDFRDRAKKFDMIILDPPKLAPTQSHADKAARAYKDINLLAMKLLEPGGILATFSCSGGIDNAFFKEIISWASQDAKRNVQIIEKLSQSNDHPVLLSFPESEYLKGFVCRVI